MWNPEKWELPKIKPRDWSIKKWIYQKEAYYHMGKLARIKSYVAENEYQKSRYRLRACRLDYAEDMMSFFIDSLIRRNVRVY